MRGRYFSDVSGLEALPFSATCPAELTHLAVPEETLWRGPQIVGPFLKRSRQRFIWEILAASIEMDAFHSSHQHASLNETIVS